eukprot:TRINITY_DN278_c0_g1_i1.p2 TRINITY_DN278_c0_g1~~TRINITY_DN278_c0_g1_i1.p2  ORF type:complete len:118 (+),score=43.32 TRINITY_DN278_c0_g1_i1:105-458(+)
MNFFQMFGQQGPQEYGGGDDSDEEQYAHYGHHDHDEEEEEEEDEGEENPHRKKDAIYNVRCERCLIQGLHIWEIEEEENPPLVEDKVSYSYCTCCGSSVNFKEWEEEANKAEKRYRH